MSDKIEWGAVELAVNDECDFSVDGDITDDGSTVVTGWVALTDNFDPPSVAVIICDLGWPNVWADGKLDAWKAAVAEVPAMVRALRAWLAYDNTDEADFSQVGPMLAYAKAINETRDILARIDGQ